MSNRDLKFRAWDGEMSFWSSEEQQFDLHEALTIDAPKIYVMQYTGLRDAKGKEIFEGDIVQDGIYRREVIFHKGVFCYQDGPKQFHIFADKYCEVIGNIYENPELLK